VIKVNGKLQANSDKTMNDPDTSEMKIWVTPPYRETQPAEGFAEGKGNTERAIEGSYKYQLWQHDQLQKWGQ
jgi:hypothetical protein